ncbi:hypothetical protein DBV15_10007 [Temnothorax longispinosus]|uniref:Uncharacterized protein n=1 Tax=Temnothorax longispinosus TaxID=300112 RepID=A0A4V3SB85_9HYME|nr:hypothetical protein DBV15_10007 [Temnothorax longispinosus]
MYGAPPPAVATKRWIPAGWQGGAVEHDSFAYVYGTPAVPGGLAAGEGGPPRRTCRLLESRKHESAKGAPSAPAAPKTGRAPTPTVRESSAYDAAQPPSSYPFAERIPPAAGLGGQSAMSPPWRVSTKVAMACTHETVTDSRRSTTGLLTKGSKSSSASTDSAFVENESSYNGYRNVVLPMNRELELDDRYPDTRVQRGWSGIVRRRRSANDRAVRPAAFRRGRHKTIAVYGFDTIVIHNIVRPHYLQLASLRVRLAVRGSSTVPPPPSVVLYIESIVRGEGARFLIDDVGKDARHTGNIEFPCAFERHIVHAFVQQHRTMRNEHRRCGDR